MANLPKLYGPNGDLVDLSLLKGTEQSAPTLSGVRNIYSLLYPADNITPEKLTGILRQADFGDPYLFLEFAEQMEEKDAHYSAVLNKRKGAVSSLEPVIKPASESPRDIEIAAFVREVLTDESTLDMNDVIYDMLDAIGKGFSVHEIIWDTNGRRGGRPEWRPIGIESRDARWFMFDWISGRRVLVRSLRTEGPQIWDGNTLDMTREKRPPGTAHLGGTWIWNREAAKIGIQPLTETLIPFKYITHFGKAKTGLPIRAGLSRIASWYYLFKIYAIKDWATFCEKYGEPIRYGRYPDGAEEKDKEILLSAVAGIGANMAGVVPKSMDIVFENAKSLSSNNDLFRLYIEHLEDSESKLVLGSTLGTQVRGGSGSRAATKEHRGVERDIMQSDARRVSFTLNSDLVRPLVTLNYGVPAAGFPKVMLGLPDDEDSSVFVKNVVTLAGSGMKIGVKVIREKLHLAEPEDDEELLTPPQRFEQRETDDGDDGGHIGEEGVEKDDDNLPQKVARQKPRGSKAKKKPNGGDASQTSRMARESNPGSPDAVAEEFSERLRDQYTEIVDPIVETVLREVRAAADWGDLKKRLDRCAGQMNPSAFNELMSKVLFSAEFAGRVGAKLE